MHLLTDVLETSQFEAGRVDFTFALPNDGPEDRARLEQLRQEFHQHLGEFIYADDATTTLEDCVSAQLLAARHTIAVVEVGSGGNLAAALCHTRCAAQVVAGAIVAPTEDQLRTVLGIADEAWNDLPGSGRLELLATIAAQRTKSPWSIVIGAVQQDPQASDRVHPSTKRHRAVQQSALSQHSGQRSGQHDVRTAGQASPCASLTDVSVQRNSLFRSLLLDPIQVRPRAEKEVAAGDRRAGLQLALQLIDRQDFVFRTRREHRRRTILAEEIDAPVNSNR
jgi:hypothetical protein